MSDTAATNQPVTVALVHGAFADSSSWNGVIERLENHNVPVTTIPNPLRGISIDGAYVRSALEQISGRVLAVGHSYGGAVITNAATGLSNVVGLVYVAAFAPEEGETLLEVDQGSRDSVLFSSLVPHQYPTADGTATEFSIDPPKTREAFASDLSDAQIALIAATQRPISEPRSGSHPVRPRGSPCRHGRSSLLATRRSARTSCASTPSAPAPPSRSSRAHT